MTEDKKEALYWRARWEEEKAKGAHYREALALILRHASAPDTAPPLRLSVQDCREIVRMVDNADPR